MIKAIIFDLNGIFVQSEKLSEKFERDFMIPTSEFMPALSLIMDKVRQPNAGSAFSYWKPVLQNWNINLNESEFWNYWFDGEKVSDKMVKYAKNLKEKGVKIFILSNNFKERAEYYSHYPWIHDVVDKVYFSWQSGFVKPNPEAWKQILNENSIMPEECLYFDDQQKNLDSAESLGIKSFLFTNEEELEKAINTEINS